MLKISRRRSEDVAVSSRYKFRQRSLVHWPAPAKLHVPHAFAGAFQKAGRIGQRHTLKEPDTYVRVESVDVTKRDIACAGGWMSIVKKLANVCATAAHLFKPWLDKPPEFEIGPGKPCVHEGVSPNGAREVEEIAHVM